MHRRVQRHSIHFSYYISFIPGRGERKGAFASIRVPWTLTSFHTDAHVHPDPDRCSFIKSGTPAPDMHQTRSNVSGHRPMRGLNLPPSLSSSSLLRQHAWIGGLCDAKQCKVIDPPSSSHSLSLTIPLCAVLRLKASCPKPH